MALPRHLAAVRRSRADADPTGPPPVGTRAAPGVGVAGSTHPRVAGNGGRDARPPVRWLRLPALFVVLFGAGILAGLLISPGQSGGVVPYLDDRVHDWVLAHRPDGVVHTLRPVVALGSVDHVAVYAAIVALLLLAFRRWRVALVLLVSVAGTDLLVGLLKQLVARPSPWAPATPGLSFPSGHTSGVTALVVPLAVLAWTTRRWWWPALAAAVVVVAMGTMLVMLDVHWASDVVVGAVLTTIWAGAVALWIAPVPLRAPPPSRKELS